MKENKKLFIIRKAALRKDVVEDIISQIKNEGYKIIDMFLVEINNEKKFYNDLYKNFDKFEAAILEDNGNKCLAIVTDAPEGLQPYRLKNKIRKQYASLFPSTWGVQGNIIHTSDEGESEEELSILLDKNKLNFKEVGTYYKIYGHFD